MAAANTGTTSAFTPRGRPVGTGPWPLLLAEEPGERAFSLQLNSGDEREDDYIMSQGATKGRRSHAVFRNGDAIKTNLPRCNVWSNF